MSDLAEVENRPVHRRVLPDVPGIYAPGEGERRGWIQKFAGLELRRSVI
jgi:hypothetical protein